MNLLSCWRIVAAVVVAGLLNPVGAQGPANTEDEKDARAAAEVYLAGMQVKDIDKMMSVVADDFTLSFVGTKKPEFRKSFDSLTTGTESTRPEIKGVDSGAGFVAVRYARPGHKPLLGENKDKVLFFARRNGAMRIVSTGDALTSGVLNRATGRFSSPKAQFSLNVPAGWTAMDVPEELASISPDGVLVLAPDLKSFCLLAFVQVPMKMDAGRLVKTALTADEGATKRLAKSYTASEMTSFSVEGLEAYRVTSHFTIEDQTRKRIRAFIAKDSLLYFFICDAIPPEEFGKLEPVFNSVIGSFSLTKPADGVTHQDQVVSNFGSGTVTGNVYENKEFNCQIAAPKGWELRTSANPADLCEMQYSAGKSIVRLFAVKNIPAEVKIENRFEERREKMKEITPDFQEIARRNMTIAGVQAVESVQKYSVEQLGKIQAKEVSLIHEGTFYVILCQTFEPDSYDKLEPDFNAIIGSFGFIR